MSILHKVRRLTFRLLRHRYRFKRRILKTVFYIISIVLIYHAILLLCVAVIIITADFEKDPSFYEELREEGHPIYEHANLTPGSVEIDRYTSDHSARIPRAVRPVNEDGFFAYKEYNKTPPPDTRRVVALGDSFTEGDGLDLSENYVSRLDALFNRTQVLNFGIRRLNTKLERRRLERKAIEYEPDVIILQVLENDIHDEELMWYYYSRIDGLLDLTVLSLETPLMESLEIQVLSLVRLRYKEYIREHEEAVTERLFADEIEKIRDIASSNNAGLVMLSFKHTSLQEKAMERLAEQDDVYFVNLPEEVGYDTDKPRLRLHEHDLHPSAFAHKQVAQHLAERIGHLLR